LNRDGSKLPQSRAAASRRTPPPICGSSTPITDGAGTPVVRERYWLTFQPGEVRVCAACHGVGSAPR